MFFLQNILLCNAGRATGFEKDDVINLLNEIALEIKPPKFITEKGESHSYLIFQSTENAVSFFNACHGKAKADKNGTPLYLNFVENGKRTEIFYIPLSSHFTWIFQSIQLRFRLWPDEVFAFISQFLFKLVQQLQFVVSQTFAYNY